MDPLKVADKTTRGSSLSLPSMGISFRLMDTSFSPRLNVWDNDFRQIYIKPYNFQPIIEFDYYLLKLIYNNEFIYNYLHNSFMLNIEKGSSFNDFLLNYHLYMTNEYKKNELVNNENINDNQFNKILIYLKKNKKHLFTKEFFTTLNKTLK